ncbi:MAG: hypothetical protein WC076_13085 [Terrimicrobiaceae bacterium]|jgi:hypothetical protein|nr:hypothetical protein [Terrimicrobiaceae bacterium]
MTSELPWQNSTPAFDKTATQALAGLCFSLLLLAICIPCFPSRIPHFSAKSQGLTDSLTDTTGAGDGSGETAAGSPEGETSGSERVNVKLEKLNTTTVADTGYDSRDWAATAKDAANRTTTFVRKNNGDLKEAIRSGSLRGVESVASPPVAAWHRQPTRRATLACRDLENSERATRKNIAVTARGTFFHNRSDRAGARSTGDGIFVGNDGPS